MNKCYNKTIMQGTYIVGIDEAGRGPLAGPITFGFVMCPKHLHSKIFKNIRDSKKLSPARREEWFNFLKTHPKLAFGTASVGAKMIDQKGLSYANQLCIRRLTKKFGAIPSLVLLDGGLKAPAELRQKTIIKGDEKIPVIAAASIIAKVTRDRKMIRLAKKFPEYGFEIHKGYGTKMHLARLAKHGPSAIHRKTFAPVKRYSEKQNRYNN